VRFDQCTIRLHSNHPDVIAYLADYYRPFACDPRVPPDLEVSLLQGPQQHVDHELLVYPPGPGKTRIKDEYADVPDGRVLRKRLTGMLFLFGGGNNLAVGPCLDNLNQAVNFVNNRFTQWYLDRGCLLCHAAGVALDGRGLAIAAVAGGGKSTLALHLLSGGLNYVTNDRLMIQHRWPDLRMLGVPKLPRINPGTILNNPRLADMVQQQEREDLERLPDEKLWALEQKHDVDVARLFGQGRISLSVPMCAAAILTWRRTDEPTCVRPVQLADRPDLLRTLIKQAGVHYRPDAHEPAPDHSEQVYLDRLGACPVIEVSGGVDFARACEACQALLAEAPGPAASR
jgi:HprK-related kinase B